eukprot:NODE_2220_length_1259_cov_93.727273_g2021_i0.p1 GENE.NODE_2220_length_1259_cov_93.727273_g2021_i0~~NODE_2220_length_1259_cov_93.727273_g2021_i0.p1  ORF type:complete len:387 (-),score=75.96 NODE_2220_length_1259_cov_93.727273_g2021_i0:97-1203(-)
MKTLAFALLLSLLSSTASVRSWRDVHAGYTFEAYVAEHNKAYANAEEAQMRRGVFERRLKEIVKHNADASKTWKETVNHLTDHTDAELSAMRGHRVGAVPRGAAPGLHSVSTAISGLPKYVDWREQGVMSEVKDQGRCGSCWAFAAVSTIESHRAIKTGMLENLSVQNILDCTANVHHCGGSGGCEGGTAELAFNAMKYNGTASEWTYPYMSYFGEDFPTCRFGSMTPKRVQVNGYVKLRPNSAEDLMHAVATMGPIAISVDASNWHRYAGGVYDGCNQASPDIDHAVQLVGYGVDTLLGPYWLVRNSWSPTWGEKGYIRLRRTTSDSARCALDMHPADGTACDNNSTVPMRVCGTCGMLSDSSYPLV